MYSKSISQSFLRSLLEMTGFLTGMIVFSVGCTGPILTPPAKIPLPQEKVLRIVGVEVTPVVAKPGDEVSIYVTYNVLTSDPSQTVPVTETWAFTFNDKPLGNPITRPTAYKTHGGYTSTYKFTVAPDALPGEAKIFVTISNGTVSQSASAQFSIRDTRPMKYEPLLHTSEQIRRFQMLLKTAGFDPGPIDGVLGPKTRAALRQYQAARELPVTGELDTTTQQALEMQ